MHASASASLRFFTILVFLFSPLCAQSGKGGGGGSKGVGPSLISNSPNTGAPPVSSNGEFGPYAPIVRQSDHPDLKNEQPPCFHWPMNPVLTGTVAAKTLETPAGALDEFSQACGAVRSRDFKEARRHLEKALQIHPQFAAAWALLGQVQEDQGKFSEATGSCNHARDAEASYLPGYLCLVDLAARQEKWDSVMQLTDQVIALHPVRCPGAFYYNALAYLNQRQVSVAEKSALRALDDAEQDQKPEVLWLLAKTYEQKGDRTSEAVQLREYLKLAPHGHEAGIARQVLAQIERQQSTRTAAPNAGK